MDNLMGWIKLSCSQFIIRRPGVPHPCSNPNPNQNGVNWHTGLNGFELQKANDHRHKMISNAKKLHKETHNNQNTTVSFY